TRVVRGQLFGATIDFHALNGPHDPRKLEGSDFVKLFSISRGSRPPLRFTGGTADQFSTWVRENAPELRRILFPTSVSESVSGKDAAENHAQQFLFNTAM